MSDTTANAGSGGDAVLAGEYALHLLSPEDRRDAEDRLAVDGGFRALVAEWSESFARLTDTIDPVDPPTRVRAALASFTGAPRGQAGAGDGTAHPRRGSLFGRWLGGGLGALVAAGAAVVLLTVALPRIDPPYSGPLYTAELQGDQSDLVVRARFDPRDNALTVTRQSGGAAPGRVLELWLIAEGAEAPVSLGVLPDGEEVRVEIPDDLSSAVPTGTLAISDEPPGGSPDAVPSGAILATGSVVDA